MPYTFYPNPEYLSSPMISNNHRFEIPRSITSVPVIKWLIENVGEIAEFKDNEWPHGNGWEMGHNYTMDVDNWENRHYIIIRCAVDEKLLTEFALRFS